MQDMIKLILNCYDSGFLLFCFSLSEEVHVAWLNMLGSQPGRFIPSKPQEDTELSLGSLGFLYVTLCCIFFLFPYTMASFETKYRPSGL